MPDTPAVPPENPPARETKPAVPPEGENPPAREVKPMPGAGPAATPADLE